MLIEQALDRIHAEKYRDVGQSRKQHAAQLSKSISSNDRHKSQLNDILLNDRFLPAGRVQAAGGSSRNSSYYNCAVSGTIEDSMESIMQRCKDAMLTLRLGTGIGYDFSNIRPKGAYINTLKSSASGPISFMNVFDAGCKTIHMSHRRGAQMGILRIDHPDILEFIHVKREDKLSSFNLSVAVTDDFMAALASNEEYELVHGGKSYGWLRAREVWDALTLCAYEGAEPGIIFIDRINANNNLRYCETIAATNPCAEQPLPPNGMCLLGSFNLTAYTSRGSIDWELWSNDIRAVVEAYDNIIDRSIYALDAHRIEAQSKRRIGLGITGIANAIELYHGKPCYGERAFNATFRTAANFLMESCYSASIDLARDRGPFPMYDDRYLDSPFIQQLPSYIRAYIETYGIRNSHLISYAPCGTISLAHGNLSSGIEPVFFPTAKRRVIMDGGKEEVIAIPDYNIRKHGFTGKTLDHVTVSEHLAVHEIAQRYCDSAVSKTINLPASTTFSEYQNVWLEAYKLGLKGLTVYRPNEVRPPVITSGDCEKGECRLSVAA